MSYHPQVTAIRQPNNGLWAVTMMTRRVKRCDEGLTRIPLARDLTAGVAVELLAVEIEAGCILVNVIAVGEVYGEAAAHMVEG